MSIYGGRQWPWKVVRFWWKVCGVDQPRLRTFGPVPFPDVFEEATDGVDAFTSSCDRIGRLSARELEEPSFDVWMAFELCEGL
jgi:hypothetical protein